MASIKDIAKLCGVSVATVSKALNDKADISEDTKQHIKQVAKQMATYHSITPARSEPTKVTTSVSFLWTMQIVD